MKSQKEEQNKSECLKVYGVRGMLGYQKIRLESVFWIIVFIYFLFYTADLLTAVLAVAVVWVIVKVPVWVGKKAIKLMKR